MLCFEERVKSRNSDSDVFVYAVPKSVKIGDTYTARDVNLRVDRYPGFAGLRPSVVIFAEMNDESHRPRYKMHIEQGRGITELHFEKLRAAPPGAAALTREYTGVSCTLVSKRGLLSGARLEAPPTTDTMD